MKIIFRGILRFCNVPEPDEAHLEIAGGPVDAPLGIAAAPPLQIGIVLDGERLGVVDIRRGVAVRESEGLDVPVLLFRIEDVE